MAPDFFALDEEIMRQKAIYHLDNYHAISIPFISFKSFGQKLELSLRSKWRSLRLAVKSFFRSGKIFRK
jgi:hypothetical protein